MKEFYSKKELEKLYGKTYATMLDDSLIPKTDKVYHNYIDNLDQIDTPKGIIEAPKALLKEILSNDELCRHLLNNLEANDGYPLKIKYINDKGKIVDAYKVSRADIVFATQSFSTSELDIRQQINVISITKLSDTKSCELRYNNYTHRCLVDGTMYTMDARSLLNLLTESSDEFNIFLNVNSNSKYEKKYIFYMLKDFVERERILKKYTFSKKVYERYENIISYKYIDFESLNKNQKSDDYDGNGESIVEKLHIDEDFLKDIQRYAKKTYGPLERAIHAYIRMCELLTYDESVFIDYKNANKHLDPIRVSTIDKNNNKVICYEFAFIYAYVLKKLGIDYTMNAKSFIDSPGYANIEFRFQEYLIRADAISNIFDSDLTNIKVGDRIQGLTCINENVSTQKKFNEISNKIRLNILNREKQLETYEKNVDDIKNSISSGILSKKDKIKVLLKVITRDNLKGLDKLIYQRKIFESIFTEEDNIKITFISNKNNPFTIISLFENDTYKYFAVNETDDSPLRVITNDELNEKIENGEYVLLENEIIPGLSENKGVSYGK